VNSVSSQPAGVNRYVPVIQADLALEETYAPSGGRLGVPVLAVVGEAAGRDKQRTCVPREAAALWLEATSAAGGSRVCSLPEVDWYVFQEPAGAAAVQREVAAFMRSV